MIIVKLMGGLGNQMFQYAFAKNLAVKNNTSLKVDLSFLLDRTPRENFVFRDYDLDIFDLEIARVSEEELSGLLNPPSLSRFKRLFSSKQQSPYLLIKEKQFNFDPSTIVTNDNVYLEGYWQTEKYFSNISNEIRKDFSFKHPLSREEYLFNRQIESTNSVCVNFRRADFVHLKNSAETHGATEMSYYENAIEVMAQKVENPHFFIFSDDIEWCMENVKINFRTTFVSHFFKGFKFSSYLQLMKNCKHFIIPNSTFAWWAAWLSMNENKIVIAPKRWFNDDTLQNQTNDIIPDNWIRLD